MTLDQLFPRWASKASPVTGRPLNNRAGYAASTASILPGSYSLLAASVPANISREGWV